MANPWHTTPSGKSRARALGIPFDGRPGHMNAITDVAGVSVGYSTLIRGEGPVVVGKGPVRTGVTAILPRERDDISTPVFAGWFSLNGAGEMTGTAWIEERGVLEGPITITTTHSCGVARDATAQWMVRNAPEPRPSWYLPVAAETFDGYLNDTNGFHVREEHVFAAIDSARGGPVEEGSVGGGTGMIAYEFKAGSGTSSRLVRVAGSEFTVGVFVQANFGMRGQLTIAGAPVGRRLTEGAWRQWDEGSIIAVVATDAPLLPHQLKRLARRVSLGIGRSGSVSGHGSGDLFLAFSTANGKATGATDDLVLTEFIPDRLLDPLFAAVIRATDESIINSMIANETMTGRDGHTVLALPHDALRDVLRLYGRLE